SSARSWNDGDLNHARPDHAGLQRLQAPELHHDEEQAQASGPGGAPEVLSVLPDAQTPQGNAIGTARSSRPARGARDSRPVAPIGRASVSKTECWGFESLLACHFQSGDRRGRARSEASWN